MTEAKLPKQPPGKTSVISAHAAMPNDLPYGQSGTGRLTLSVSLRPPNLRPFQTRSIIQWRCRDFRLSPKVGILDHNIPYSPTGAITDSAPKVRREPCPSNPKVKHNRSLCNSRLSPPDYTTPIMLTISGSASSTVHLRIRSVGAAGDIELPLGANALQARQGVQDFRHTMRGFVLRP